MKHCSSLCQHFSTKIIIDFGDAGTYFDTRCTAQKGEPRVTLDTYCPYDEISNTMQETNNDIKKLKQELEVYKKALYEACEDLAWEISSPDYTQEIVDTMLERVKNDE